MCLLGINADRFGHRLGKTSAIMLIEDESGNCEHDNSCKRLTLTLPIVACAGPKARTIPGTVIANPRTAAALQGHECLKTSNPLRDGHLLPTMSDCREHAEERHELQYDRCLQKNGINVMDSGADATDRNDVARGKAPTISA